MGGIPASTSQYEVHSFTSNTGQRVKCLCLWSCFIPSSNHRKLLVSFKFCCLKAFTEGHNDIYVGHHMMQFFSRACKVNKTEPVLFVHTPPLLNYISLAHGLKFCKAFLKILLMVAILCQKVHLACKFKHGLQIFKSWAYCSNKHFQQGGEKLQGIHFQHNSSSGTSPPLTPNKTTTHTQK